ncbi:major facilitator superfamily domain-containing protein [Bisporella sp. PMI_857]|nr:major facilitator superfamily domain-containing protein [Bisporella sp. PMI_857]
MPQPTGATELGNTTDLEKTAVVLRSPESQDGQVIGDPIGDPEAIYSIFSIAEKRFITLIAALTTLFPPLTANIYYPVIPLLAKELNVSISAISLTVTVYLIVQGLAPSFIGNLSDETGRRPALILSFVIYIAGCIGAALKGNYALLMTMRCLQSAGSSGTIALSLATVSDIVTSAERGIYTSYVQMGWMLGPTLGPVLGGLLSQYLGWRSIFWFLTIFGSLVFTILLIFLPETSRNVVGNGFIPARKWNMSLLAYLHTRKQRKASDNRPGRKFHIASKAKINPLNSMKLFFDKESSILLFYSGSIYASTYMVLSTLPDQLEEKYGLDTLHTSLCYLATGFGTISSVLLVGRILDWNFRRHAKLLGIEISKNKQQDLKDFPIEIARLQVSLPLLFLSGTSLIVYGWTMQARTSLALPMIFLFLQSFGGSGAFSGLNNLIMDLNRAKPGTASAAMNMARCWMGAAGVAVAGPLNHAGGAGWLAVTIAGIWLVFSPLALLAINYGPKWREGKRLRNLEDAARK